MRVMIIEKRMVVMAKAFWKVCRKLANEERLDVLRRVLISPVEEGLSVGQVSDMVRLGQPATSTYLAQLQNECGLVASTRDGKYCLYRAMPDKTDTRLMTLFTALKKFFRDESAGFVFVNGRRPKPPKFLSVLPALANEARVRLLQNVRTEKRTDKPRLMKATGLTELNVRRHVACLSDCGLVEIKGSEIVWREPSDPLSQLFIQLSLS